MNKKVYIAGPYSNGDVVSNVRSAIVAAEECIKYNLIPFVPHLCYYWHLLYEHPQEFWYNYDLEFLRICDYLLRLPGYSLGADKEIEEANRLGIPVFYSLEELFREVLKNP